MYIQHISITTHILLSILHFSGQAGCPPFPPSVTPGNNVFKPHPAGLASLRRDEIHYNKILKIN